MAQLYSKAGKRQENNGVGRKADTGKERPHSLENGSRRGRVHSQDDGAPVVPAEHGRDILVADDDHERLAIVILVVEV